ncbi:MAG: hypothetical protein HLUCCA11_12220 [Phormidesmis priestleyi Ana]|uniref:Uncharacterized protein n=1 Tax=Phormidesmis priestleyi Ana TaxID=1666911 RepID=A0A0P7YY53_9CYAN|nr:MAG: hypothetical protein HLUCCA11_12220 [Phormidesmis priestleyi Ana]
MELETQLGGILPNTLSTPTKAALAFNKFLM